MVWVDAPLCATRVEQAWASGWEPAHGEQDTYDDVGVELARQGRVGRQDGHSAGRLGPNVAKVLDLAVVQKIVSVVVLCGSGHGFFLS